MVVVVLEKVKEMVGFDGILELWWFKWRWRKKKMMVEGWRSCSCCVCGGGEGRVGDD